MVCEKKAAGSFIEIEYKNGKKKRLTVPESDVESIRVSF